MASKRVIEREESSLAVEQAAIVFGPQAAEKLVARLGGGGPAEVAPRDLPQLVRFLGLALERSRVRMVEADLAHDGARLSRQIQRRRRRAAALELRRQLVETRYRLANCCAPGSAARRVAAGPTARHDDLALLRQAEEVVSLLRLPESPAEVAARSLPGVSMDFSVLAEALDEARRALVEARQAAHAAQQAAAATRAARARALTAHDATFRQASRLLVALLEIAGMAAWAGQLRPRRRPHRAVSGDPLAAGPPAVNGSAS